MKSDFPTISNYPLFIIPILSAKASASSRWCVVKMIVLFSYFKVSRISHNYLLDTESIPLVGSSKRIILEPPIRAIPKFNFLLFPPDKCLANLVFSYSKAILGIIELISYSNSVPFFPLIFP